MTEEKNKPIEKIKAGSITASIWETENKEGVKYNTVTLQRSYKDKENQWQNTQTLRVSDINDAILVLNKAYEYCKLKDNHQK